MYQVTVKGRTLLELKDAVNDINNELQGGTVVSGIEKNLEVDKIVDVIKEVALPVVESTPLAEVLAPAVAIAPVPVAAHAGVELDVEGIPWDKRIHAASKGKVAAGTWRTKRGIDPALLAATKAELLQAINLAANPVAIPAAPITPSTPAVAAPVIAAPVAVAPPVVEAPVAIPAAVVAPVAPPVVLPTVSGHSVQSFKDNMAMTIGTLITEGKLTQDYVNTLKAHFGVEEIWNVSEAQKEEMFTTFVSHGIISQVA